MAPMAYVFFYRICLLFKIGFIKAINRKYSYFSQHLYLFYDIIFMLI